MAGSSKWWTRRIIPRIRMTVWTPTSKRWTKHWTPFVKQASNVWSLRPLGANRRRISRARTRACKFKRVPARQAGHQISPRYLPDGRIVFASTRQTRSPALCLDDDLQAVDHRGMFNPNALRLLRAWGCRFFEMRIEEVTLTMRNIACSGLLALFLATGAQAEPAPDFTLKSNTGENLRLAEQRGKVVMINFWASWCAPCRQEMPFLDELYQRYERAGFTLFGVNVEQDNSAAQRFLEEIEVSFPILFDPTSDVSRAYQVSAMPTTVMVDRDGQVRYVNRGYRPGDEEKYQEQIQELIRE